MVLLVSISNISIYRVRQKKKPPRIFAVFLKLAGNFTAKCYTLM